jgi:hypothetical protein
LEAEALAGGRPFPSLVFTTDRQLPRGRPATVDALIRSLDRLLTDSPAFEGAMFLRPTDDGPR